MDVTASFSTSTTTTSAKLDVNVASVDPALHTSGTVTSKDGTIACPEVCEHDFDPGTLVTLTATAGEGSAFDSWEGCESPSGAAWKLTLDAATTVTALFRRRP